MGCLAKAREILKSFNADSADPLRELCRPNSARKRNSVGDEAVMTKKMRTPDTGEISILSPLPPVLAYSASPQDDKEIPKTIRDIYKLSNENRRKNKDKKKLKHGTGSQGEDTGTEAMEVSGVLGVAGETSLVASVRIESADKPHQSAEITSPNDFMKDIGWIDPDDSKEESSGGAKAESLNSMRGKAKQERQQQRRRRQRSRNHSGSDGAPSSNPTAPVVPFDYSKTPAGGMGGNTGGPGKGAANTNPGRGPVFDPYEKPPRPAQGTPGGLQAGKGMVPNRGGGGNPRSFSFQPGHR